MIAEQNNLFEEVHPARFGSPRGRQSLFIPRLLRKAGEDQRLQGEEQNHAHEIICKWADLESSGKLQKMKETTLQGEFLAEVFGDALGYVKFSEDKDYWELETAYKVDGGFADAAIGVFGPDREGAPVAMIELKGPTTNLDRDRFNGRSAVQQCWDYLNEAPDCPWGIVCNYVSFRLYHRNKTPRSCQLFTLQDLRKIETFREFYFLFERGGLLPPTKAAIPRAEKLLQETDQKQREVGDELYKYYYEERRKLIFHLTRQPHSKTTEKALYIAQKLLDRIIFVAFCEDRGLLPAESIKQAYSTVAPFDKVTNPRWCNFLNLFRSVDEGNRQFDINAYNGGLFREDDEVDSLSLEDQWTDPFYRISNYDFRDEVNVEVLGHLFEKSVSDIGEIKLYGLLGTPESGEESARMDKSAERKRSGIYYTPPEFTAFIVRHTVGSIVEARFDQIAREDGIDRKKPPNKPSKKQAAFYRKCIEALRTIKVVDPACGSGAFLIAAYNFLDDTYIDLIDQLAFHEGQAASELGDSIADFILHDNLYGVDYSAQAVEISQLALWIRSARKGKTLADLTKNVVCGNSLVGDPACHPAAMNWRETFPEVFDREQAGFDCVIGNPPWERIKLQEREFFDGVAPEIATAVSAAKRRELVEGLEAKDPALFARFREAKELAEKSLDYVRNCGRYPLTGKGDINTYSVFAELANEIVSPHGRVGLLVPTGIATDNTTKEFFGELTTTKRLTALYDFENRKKIFPDVDGRFKFCVLLYGGSETRSKHVDFVFFAHQMEEIQDKRRHMALSGEDISLLNPNTHTCPIFRSSRDAEITKSIYKCVPVLVDKSRKEGGNPWGVKFLTMFHQTNDAELFHTAEQLKDSGYRRDGANWRKKKDVFLPLYEAKMVQMFDHRAASIKVDSTNWMRQGQPVPTSLVEHQNPEYCAQPRWWVQESRVLSLFGSRPEGLLAYKDVTSATNQRTMIAAFLPLCAVMNSAPIVQVTADMSLRLRSCFLASLNSIPLDFVARQKVGGVHLNFFIVEQLPCFSPDFYTKRCPWNQRTTLEKWVSDRVLKLTCTSNDMIPLAQVAGFDPPVHKWDPEERANLQAELDAAYFILYGIQRDDVEYILTTFQGIAQAEEGLFGHQGSAALVLSHYDRLVSK